MGERCEGGRWEDRKDKGRRRQIMPRVPAIAGLACDERVAFVSLWSLGLMETIHVSLVERREAKGLFI